VVQKEDEEMNKKDASTLTLGSDLVVNRLGYGAVRLTGSGMWGEYPDRDGGMALLKHVVEAGVTFIDTADAYGPHTNEVLIHDALSPYSADLVIATKGGFIRGGPDYADFGAVGNREYLRQCAYLSARRLGVERIDLYYLHSPNATDAPFEDQIAIAWLLHRSPFMLPIPGTSSLAHLKELLDAEAIDLTDEDVMTITQLVPEETEVPKET
jgi:aryl-alcohol dehydrogenase-like predicted oxidoreductase